MSKDIRKISRGQVWFLIDQDLPAVHYQDSVQGKNRPWLIVSNNSCNQHSTVFTAVPLTSQAKKDLPTHVEFQVEDRKQTVVCEQLRTVPERLFYNSGSNYKYTLSDETMQKVDEALSTQLGLSLVMPNAEKFWKSIESMIRLKVKEVLNYTKIDAVDFSKIASIIDVKTSEFVAKEVVLIEEHGNVEDIKYEPEKEEVKKSEKIFIPVKARGRRNAWNETNKKKFLDDLYKYGVDYCMQEYNMERTSVYATRSKFTKERKNAST